MDGDGEQGSRCAREDALCLESGEQHGLAGRRAPSGERTRSFNTPRDRHSTKLTHLYTLTFTDTWPHSGRSHYLHRLHCLPHSPL